MSFLGRAVRAVVIDASQQQHKSVPVGDRKYTLSRTPRLGRFRQRVFSPSLKRAVSCYLLIECSAIAAACVLGHLVSRMLQRADARVPSSVLGVYSSTLVLCEFPSSPAKRLI